MLRARAHPTDAPAPPERPWVRRSLADTMPATQVGATALVQPAFVAAATVSDIAIPGALLSALHLLLGVLGAATVRKHMTAVPFMVAWYALATLDFAAARTVDEPIVTVAFAVLSLTAPMPLMLYRGKWPVVAAALVTPAILGCLWLADPGIDPTLTTAIVTMNTGFLLTAILLINPIRRFADQADSSESEAAREHQRAVRSKAAITVAAESARTLHDTVINTLGAIARGSSGVLDAAIVRERCRRDADQIDALLLPTARSDQADSWQLGRHLTGSQEIRRSGLDDHQLNRYLALLPPAVARAMQGCVDEAIQNALKHSGADHVDVDARVTGTELTIQVADAGIGFDGEIVAGRGLAESVFARAEANGIRATLRTGYGIGTQVTLAYELDRTDASPPPNPEGPPGSDVVAAMHRKFCWVWAAVHIGCGIVTETVNRRGHLTTAHLMLLLVAALAALSWLVCRGGKQLPWWLTFAIVLGSPAACALAFQAVDYGWDQAFLQQSPALAPLIAILVILGPRRWPVVAAVVLMIAAIAVPAGFHPGPGWRPLVTVVAMSTPLFALLCALFFFYRGFDVFGRRLAKSWQTIEQAHRDVVAREAADVVRRRWNAAGLEGSVALLRAIANGEVDPADSGVRRRCLHEESHLRELTYLTPDQGLMGWWFALALTEARSRSVQMHLQFGTTTVSDVDAAEAFGRLALLCVTSVDPGSSIVASVFVHRDGARLFLVTDDPGLAAKPASAPPRCHVEVQATATQTVWEAEWSRQSKAAEAAGTPSATAEDSLAR